MKKMIFIIVINFALISFASQNNEPTLNYVDILLENKDGTETTTMIVPLTLYANYIVKETHQNGSLLNCKLKKLLSKTAQTEKWEPNTNPNYEPVAQTEEKELFETFDTSKALIETSKQYKNRKNYWHIRWRIYEKKAYLTHAWQESSDGCAIQ